MTALAADLQPIYELELRLGNEINYVAEPAGSACPYAVVFKHPLHQAEIQRALELAPTVKHWESFDTHYPVEAGYQCELTRHTIAGPIPRR
jgi:hypothetical protein